MRRIIIVSPHPDDAIIGAYQILMKKASEIDIFYLESDFGCETEVNCLQQKTNVGAHHFEDRSLLRDALRSSVGEISHIIAPDPYWDTHLEHRLCGAIAIDVALVFGINLIQYSTRMNAPYVRPLEASVAEKKKDLLNFVHPSQESLWKYDYRFWLFEGNIQWIDQGCL